MTYLIPTRRRDHCSEREDEGEDSDGPSYLHFAGKIWEGIVVQEVKLMRDDMD